jgi:hypothetical protein
MIEHWEIRLRQLGLMATVSSSAQNRAFHDDERWAETFNAGVVFIAGGLIDAALTP